MDARREFVRILKAPDEEINLQKLVESGSNMCNVLCFDASDVTHEIVVDKVAKSRFTPICAAWIYTLAFMYKNGLYDGRNEYSCTIGKLILDDLLSKKICRTLTNWDGCTRYTCQSLQSWTIKNCLTPDIGGSYSYYFSSEHRTIQQTFSNLVFYFIKNFIFEKDVETCINTYGINWDQCPLI